VRSRKLSNIMPLNFSRAYRPYRPYQVITLLVTAAHLMIILFGIFSFNARSEHGAQIVMMASLIDQTGAAPTKTSTNTSTQELTQQSVKKWINTAEPTPKVLDSEKSQSHDLEKSQNDAKQNSQAEVSEPDAAALTMPNPFAQGLDNPKPPYPLISRRLNEEGRVVLNVCVSLSGLVEKLKLEKTSGYQRLDHIAIETVKKWKFIPAKHQDRDINACYLLPVQFILRKENSKLNS